MTITQRHILLVNITDARWVLHQQNRQSEGQGVVVSGGWFRGRAVCSWSRYKKDNRDLMQARTATAVNKQLNFTVKNKPHTTNYIYCIFEAYFMIKSV